MEIEKPASQNQATPRLPIEAQPQAATVVERLLERNLVPDRLIRLIIRRICAARLREQQVGGAAQQALRKHQFIAELQHSPIAIHTQDANAQHYEVPAEFFHAVLGKRLKYSCGYWPDGVQTLDESEAAMLELYCQRAQLEDGQEVLELGCGWGSLSLYLAERFPQSRIVGVSNSRTQKAFIEAQAKHSGLSNLEIRTADMNDFDAAAQFDRIVSIEMFEHMRNYETLLSRIASWLKPDALLFVHIFTHKQFAYPYEVRDASDWMAKYFFTGGIMPSDDLLGEFQQDLKLIEHWQVDGTHYQKTSEAWLTRMDDQREKILELFAQTYGEAQKRRWLVRWRLFFMACAELFGYQGGSQWLVSHYLFKK
ncbi:MAG: class I SAM-dependent methyltransferase [Acidobacteria bacterium]|nr:class I SAM-dependent methyltransferase [Acidobacteriota bacterium]